MNILKCIRILFSGSKLIPFIFFEYFLVMLANVTSIYKKSHKENPENYRPVPEKVMEQIILRKTTGHVWDNQGIRPSQ